MSCAGFKRIFAWGPLIALGLIKSITWSTIICIGMWWPPKTLGGSLNMFCFISLSGLTMYNFLSTMFHGPGYLPLKWAPTNPDDCQFLQKCGVCFGYKAPRAHHCRKCGRCVLKMDHHCPWINNCVGWGNHAHFIYFLLFAALGGLHASIILGCSIYRALYSRNYVFYKIENVPLVHLNGPKLYMAILSGGFAAGVTIAVGMLLVVQLRAVLRNQTGIEDWIMAKAKCRRQNSNTPFSFPYDLGWWNNMKQVLTFSGHPVGDGIYWPVRDGCNQYTLTIEQIEQKHDKRLKTRLYRVIRPVAGYWLPIVHGTKVCCNVPFTDEPRLKLDVGDTIRVTRWRKHWLFGEKIQPDLPEGQESLLRQRGWFPKPCVTPLVEVEHKVQMNTEKKIK